MILKTMSVQISDADIRNATCSCETSPEFAGFPAELSADLPITHKLFPLIWPANLA